MRVDRQYLDRIPELEKVEAAPSSTLYVGNYDEEYFERSWHHHPEYELLLVTGGSGTRYVGDSVEAFQNGDLVLLGPRLPHAWVSQKEGGVAFSERASSTYVQFKGSMFASAFSALPEMEGVLDVLQRSARGLKVVGNTKKLCVAILEGMPEAGSAQALLDLVRILDLIAGGTVRYLSSQDFLAQSVPFKSRRMMRIHRYLSDRMDEEIRLDEAAGLVNMTKTSFCRFFREQTNLTFTVYSNRLKVDFARKLLRDTEMQVKEIGYECGFTSISYFNQVFKKYTGLSPRQYRALL